MASSSASSLKQNELEYKQIYKTTGLSGKSNNRGATSLCSECTDFSNNNDNDDISNDND